MKFICSLFFICLFSNPAIAQKKSTVANNIKTPKLVVGIVIDQMRWDYLYRFYNRYSESGFKKLLNKGFSFENTFLPYVPTYTAVGHASIYTGGIPATHGMIGNNWFDKRTGKNIYCTQDSTVKGVGNNDVNGKMSPRNMWATSITDELRLSNNFKSKVVGIALKDRGAILPAGQSANAAYWYDDKNGRWISSTFYMQQLPEWVNTFNEKDEAGTMLKNDWHTLYPIETYTQSTADKQDYETPIVGLTASTFPHLVSTVTTQKYTTFKYTPDAATFSFNFAKAAIAGEKLGQYNVTDFLTLSISSTDYMGHYFGPNSVETEDTYLRLDKDIGDFLKYLDATIGKNEYVVFVSSDHGAAHIPAFLNAHNINAGMFSNSAISQQLNKLIDANYGLKKAVSIVQNYQVYIDFKMLNENKKDVPGIKKLILETLKNLPYVTDAFETENINNITLADPLKKMLINGYAPTRSGDIQFILKPGFFDGGQKGTVHGLWNPYDAHIPLLFYGWNIKPGKTYRETYVTDIAPTLAAMLHIQMPSGCVGKVLEELVK